MVCFLCVLSIATCNRPTACVSLVQFDTDVQAHFDAIWWLLAISIAVAFHALRNVLFTPYEKLGVFTIVISRTYPQVLDYISRI